MAGSQLPINCNGRNMGRELGLMTCFHIAMEGGQVVIGLGQEHLAPGSGSHIQHTSWYSSKRLGYACLSVSPSLVPNRELT